MQIRQRPRTEEQLDEKRVRRDARRAGPHRRLEDEGVVAEHDEKVVALVDGLKKAVHHLRDFAQLIEPKLEGQSDVGPAIEELRRTIHELESLANRALGSSTTPASDTLPARGTAFTGSAATHSRRHSAPAHVRLGRVVDSAARNVIATHEGLELELELEDRLPETPVSDKSLEEVLIVLLRNAAEAMGGAGRASIEAHALGAGLELAVLDEGPGFAKIDPAELFKPGYTTKPGGGGYGLFLARRIVEEHGGRLELGAAPEGGARVVLWLPAVPSGE